MCHLKHILFCVRPGSAFVSSLLRAPHAAQVRTEIESIQTGMERIHKRILLKERDTGKCFPSGRLINPYSGMLLNIHALGFLSAAALFDGQYHASSQMHRTLTVKPYNLEPAESSVSEACYRGTPLASGLHQCELHGSAGGRCGMCKLASRLTGAVLIGLHKD